MLRPRLTARSARTARLAALAAGGAVLSLPVIGALSHRVHGSAPPVAPDPATMALIGETERAAQAQTAAPAHPLSGVDPGAATFSAEGLADLGGLASLTLNAGRSVLSAGIDGAGEVASLAGKGVHGLLDVASTVGGAMPDRSDLADLAGAAGAVAEVAGGIAKVAGSVLGAIGDGLGDFNW